MKQVLRHPSLYHFLRQAITLGIPFRQFVREFKLDDPATRVVDIGCGPVDLLRYVPTDRHVGYYLGVDQSERYLADARHRASTLNIPSHFEAMDLARLTTSPDLRNRLTQLIAAGACTQAMLLGVLHHIADDDAMTTLTLLREAKSIQRVFTWDVVLRPGRRINNLFAHQDRGMCVRDEKGYENLIRKSGWSIARVFWTHPGLQWIDYLHYELVRA